MLQYMQLSIPLPTPTGDWGLKGEPQNDSNIGNEGGRD